jgi:4-amino-4-deoxy-L-arabinose transferase-like glycosyltransferase
MAAATDIHPKVAAASGGGVLATIIILIASQEGVTIDPALGAAIATAVAAFFGWLKRATSETVSR